MFRQRDFISSRIKRIESEIGRIDKRIRTLNRVKPRTRKDKVDELNMSARLYPTTPLPEAQKRFVSYLSTGSFQTIGLRQHEQRNAKVKMILTALGAVVGAFIIIYIFFRSLF